MNKKRPQILIVGILTLIGLIIYCAVWFLSSSNVPKPNFTSSSAKFSAYFACKPIEKTSDDLHLALVLIAKLRPTNFAGCVSGTGDKQDGYAVYSLPYAYPQDPSEQKQKLRTLQKQTDTVQHAVAGADTVADMWIKGCPVVIWTQPMTDGHILLTAYIFANGHFYYVQAIVPTADKELGMQFIGSFTPSK